MKKTNLMFASLARKAAEKSLTRDANSTSCGAIYQPKAPEALKKFSKINKV